MSVYRIREYGEPILRKQCVRVDSVGLREKRIFDRIARTMYEVQGIGLAACQVGIDRQLMVIDVGGGLIKLANPLVMSREDESTVEEGCLSIPGVTVKVKRAMRVLVQGLNEEGRRTKIEGEGLLAHALQHEVDHLSGILIIDYASSQEKESFQSELRELEKKARLK
ncbi:MAG TPA: peptide deformylase [Candidatus Scalindua sp.]|nr:peptide deformylase [Candidatus Scalindua sp.]